MKNFPVTDAETGKEYWISRAMAVVGIILVYPKPTTPSTSSIIIPEEYEPKFLISQRGPGCPDHIGKWQFTCGYLDFDETLEEGLKREVREELGIDLDEVKAKITMVQIIDDPNRDTRQNVSFRYLVMIKEEDLGELPDVISLDTESRGGEKGEISAICLGRYEDIKDFEFAFNHREILEQVQNGHIFDDPRFHFRAWSED